MLLCKEEIHTHVSLERKEKKNLMQTDVHIRVHVPQHYFKCNDALKEYTSIDLIYTSLSVWKKGGLKVLLSSFPIEERFLVQGSKLASDGIFNTNDILPKRVILSI